jgi:trigger factor
LQQIAAACSDTRRIGLSAFSLVFPPPASYFIPLAAGLDPQNKLPRNEERLFVNVTVENLGPCKKLLRLDVDAEKVEAAFQECTADFQREARLPGFRPGKAPKDMVTKRFEKEIEGEVRQKLIREAFRETIKEHKITIMGQPEVEEVQFARGKPMQLAITTEIAPEFELPDYKGLPARRENKHVTPDDIERALHVLAEQRTQYQTVDRELQTGDIAVINYNGQCDGKPISDTAPTARGLTAKTAFWVNVDATSFIPGFGSQLAGMKARDKRSISVDFPPDFVVPQLAGKKGLFDVELVEAKEKKIPAIDDEFAKLFGAANVEKLREGVRADLQNELNNKQSRLIRNQVAQNILDRVQIPLPDSLVEQETRSIVYGMVQERAQQGVPKEVIDAQKEQIYGMAKATAEQRIKAAFIFQKVAEKEGVRVEQMDLLHRLQELAAQYKMPVDKLHKDLQKSGRLEDVAEQILNEKVVDLLVQFARIEDTVAP